VSVQPANSPFTPDKEFIPPVEQANLIQAIHQTVHFRI